MNGTDMKKAAINKAKSVAQAASSNNGNKKRRKGQDLKPIITTEKEGSQNASPAGSTGSFHYKYVHHTIPTLHPITSPTHQRARPHCTNFIARANRIVCAVLLSDCNKSIHILTSTPQCAERGLTPEQDVRQPIEPLARLVVIVGR
jgi:hypothetical protein